METRTQSTVSIFTKERVRWTIISVTALSIVALMSGSLGSNIEHAKRVASAMGELSNSKASRLRVNNDHYYASPKSAPPAINGSHSDYMDISVGASDGGRNLEPMDEGGGEVPGPYARQQQTTG